MNFRTFSFAALSSAALMAPGLAQAGDWTGAYAGVQLGYGDYSANPGASDSGALYGVQLGYDYDMGNWVIGGRLDYTGTNIVIATTSFDSVARLGLRAGYDMGQGLAYGIAGATRATTSNAGNDTGWFAGLGYEHMVRDQISVNAELLYHRHANFGITTSDVEATVLTIGLNYRF